MPLLPDVAAYVVAEQVLAAEVVDEPWLLQVWVEFVDEGSGNDHQHIPVGSHNEHDPWMQAAVDDSSLVSRRDAYVARGDSWSSSEPLRAWVWF